MPALVFHYAWNLWVPNVAETRMQETRVVVTTGSDTPCMPAVEDDATLGHGRCEFIRGVLESGRRWDVSSSR